MASHRAKEKPAHGKRQSNYQEIVYRNRKLLAQVDSRDSIQKRIDENRHQQKLPRVEHSSRSCASLNQGSQSINKTHTLESTIIQIQGSQQFHSKMINQHSNKQNNDEEDGFQINPSQNRDYLAINGNPDSARSRHTLKSSRSAMSR